MLSKAQKKAVINIFFLLLGIALTIAFLVIVVRNTTEINNVTIALQGCGDGLK